MPFIRTKTTKSLTKEQKIHLKEAYGRAIELLPGKTEKWLMLAFEDGAYMAFHGDTESDMAFLEVSLVGSAPDTAYDALTARLCELIGEVLDIAPDMIYIKYEECSHWGWNGINF